MANHWSSGYVADMTYSHGYYHELAPPFIRFFLLMNGYANALQGGDYRYCELGFGQGVSCNLHAAANPRGHFSGTDFNPEHAFYAQQLAHEAGVTADWRGLSFEQMLDADLPPMDMVVLHGVWSWVDAAGRHALVEFLRRRLKVGGVVFISYNTMPGWSAEQPLRDLMWMHTQLAGAAGDATSNRIKAAVQFAQRLRQHQAAFFERNAPASQMLDDMARDDMHVVAHEYFNRSWHLSYFADVAQSLDAAGLSFACSLHRSDLTGEVYHKAQPFELQGLPPALRQTAHDFILNRRFRRDVFVRGGVKLPRAHRDQKLQSVELVLLRPASTISAQQQTPYGTVSLDPTITSRLSQALEAAGGRGRMADLISQADLHSTPRERVYETVAALVAQSQLAPVFADDAEAPRAGAQAINRVICERSRHDDQLRYLCSPVTGQAIEASRADRLLLAAWNGGAHHEDPLCKALQSTDDGAHTNDPGGDDAAGQVRQFLSAVLPLWQRLGIVNQEAQ